jgi:hypothetical protein
MARLKDPSDGKPLKLKRAWLITWEKVPPEEDRKVASILNGKRSEEHVRKYMEQLYADLQYGLKERLLFAKSETSRRHALQADFEHVHCVAMNGGITCGGNPSLYARRVTNLTLLKDPERGEFLEWEEIEASDLAAQQDAG